MQNWKNSITNFVPTPIIQYNWKDDVSLKEQFGVELAKNHSNPFIAACQIFGKETQKALFASVNWLIDEVVIAAKEKYNAVTAPDDVLLDKDGLCRKLQVFAEEKINFNGNSVYSAEAKDRLAAYRLFADIRGFISKETINNTINNKPQFMEIKFVEPDKKEVKTIEHDVIQEENILENSPIKLKLVG